MKVYDPNGNYWDYGITWLELNRLMAAARRNVRRAMRDAERGKWWKVQP